MSERIRDVCSPEAHELISQGVLNPDLDIPALAEEFQANGRIQIENALRPEVARVLRRCLGEKVPWELAFRDRSGSRKLYTNELAAMSPAQMDALGNEIYAIARKNFQFVYNSYMMVPAYKEKRNPELPLHRVLEQINKPAWMDPMRQILNRPDAKSTYAQATRYIAGHFLRHHDDSDYQDGEGRLAAYVINLSLNWQADWGGLLQFFDDQGRVTETFMPRFNTISMFKVPAPHCVSPVAPFCDQGRYAITGWIRS